MIKENYSIQEYIDNPPSNEDIKAFRKRESIKGVIRLGGVLLVSLPFAVFAPGELKITAVFAAFLTYLCLLYPVDKLQALKGIRITDTYVVESGYSKTCDLYEHHADLTIPEVVTLKANIANLGRDYIALDRAIIQELYLNALHVKSLELTK